MTSVIIQSILLGVALAMDAFSVSLTDGIILGKPRLRDAVKIAFFFGAFQFIMPVLGYLAGSTFAGVIEAFDHWVAFALLVIIGAKMILEAVCPKGDEPEADNPLSIHTLFVLAVATSIDALAVGVTFATIATPVILSSAIIGAVTFCICISGVFLGGKCGNFAGRHAGEVGGAILILIGIKILAEHLFF